MKNKYSNRKTKCESCKIHAIRVKDCSQCLYLYQKKYLKNNPHAIKARRDGWKRYRDNNREKVLAAKREHYYKNRGEVKKYGKTGIKDSANIKEYKQQWYLLNKDRVKKQTTKWYKSNKERKEIKRLEKTYGDFALSYRTLLKIKQLMEKENETN